MRNKLIKWIAKSTSYGKLRTKLLCIYFLLIVVPLALFSLYSNFRVRSVIQEQTLTAAQNAFDDTFLAVERIWGQLDEVIDILATDPLVYAMASNDPRDFTYIQRLQDSDQLATTFEQLRLLSGVDRIQLYVNNEYSYSNDHNNIIQISEINKSAWYQFAATNAGRLWCAPSDYLDQAAEEQQWFSSLQTIFNPRSIKEPLAIVRVDIDAFRLSNAVNGTSITENGVVLIMRDNNVILASNPTNYQNIPTELVNKLASEKANTWNLLEEDRTKYYVQRRSLTSNGWSIASILPAEDVFQPSNALSAEMLVIVTAVTLAAYLLAYLLSRSTLDRLSLLTKTMQTVENGNIAVRLEPSGNDEISQLMGSFNQMMDQLDTLMEEKVEYGRQIKNLELKALQAQINPHFLYNSLDLINCTAISSNVPAISKMVNALSKFYRLSLSKGREVISLGDELKHARLYLEIQNMRFDDRISVVWDLEPSIENCQIIKIILQPIIENSVIHGIFEKPSKSGTITVSTKRCEDGIRITVADDGVGMDEETIKANFSSSLSGEIAETKGGYGVKNICDRVKLAYGDPYGVSCTSIPGQGTVVTIHIPIITE